MFASSSATLSVAIVCDYGAGSAEGWGSFRRSMKGLAAQTFKEPVEFLLCESEKYRGQIPADLFEILPGLKLVWAPGETAYDLKNAAVNAASGEWVATLDADCVPQADWLERIVQCVREHPDISALSGRTTYGGKELSVRMNALLGRAYLDPGSSGPTQFIAGNNAAYRRSAFLEQPLDASLGNFTDHVHSSQLHRSGHKLWFESSVAVEHDFEGWSTEKDIRRNRGYSTIYSRLKVRTLPYAGLVRLGPISIVPILGWKILAAWRDLLRCGAAYGIRWYETPAVAAGAVAVSLMEAPGMLAAFRGEALGPTFFR